MKYEGMEPVRGEVRRASGDAVYIRRKRFSYAGSDSGSFFNKLFRQFFATMTALIMLFTLNLIPLTRGFIDDVKEVVTSDYTEDVLTVFNHHD